VEELTLGGRRDEWVVLEGGDMYRKARKEGIRPRLRGKSEFLWSQWEALTGLSWMRDVVFLGDVVELAASNNRACNYGRRHHLQFSDRVAFRTLQPFLACCSILCNAQSMQNRLPL
jgi:hypothetical protein